MNEGEQKFIMIKEQLVLENQIFKLKRGGHMAFRKKILLLAVEDKP